MSKFWYRLALGVTTILALVILIQPGFTEEETESESASDDEVTVVDEELDTKKQEIEELEKKLNEIQGEKQTLASTISYLNGKIELTQAQIDRTQNQLRVLRKDISNLSLQIDQLDASLDAVSHLLLNRIRQTYIRSRITPVTALIASNNLGDLLRRYKYLQLTQKNDREVMYQMEATRVDYDQQKNIKVEKQAELDLLNAQLEIQQANLAQQQQEKEVLLELTRNDEKRFQSQLAEKRAELEAIQSIIAGKGDETEVGEVKVGDTIAEVIPGPSTCSSGAHLHFEVANSGTHRNPADYLSNKSVIWDNGPDTPFGFGGSWPWPLNDSIRITQGYGMTFYAGTMRYYGGAPHTGIDMVNNSDYSVKSVSDGVLYRGSIPCRGGTLRYVRVEHSESLSSFYLHVNY